MLEKIDLTKKVPKAEYTRVKAGLRNRLYDLQKASWDADLPVVIVFEGWDASGKGTTIQYLTSRLDPRGFKLHPIRPARTYEMKRPWLWRYWLKIPGRGEWAIFDRSWYGRVLVERMEKLIPKRDWRRAYRDIADFERTLADDGYLFCKFFLHISKKEQRKRFDRLEADPLTAWKVEKEDWKRHKQYKKWVRVYEEMFERTETEWGPWTIVEATDRRHTRLKVLRTIASALEDRLADLGALPLERELEADAAPAATAETSESAQLEDSTEATPADGAKPGTAARKKAGEEDAA